MSQQSMVSLLKKFTSHARQLTAQRSNAMGLTLRIMKVRSSKFTVTSWFLGSVHFDMCKTSCQQNNCNSETLHAEPGEPGGPEGDSSVGKIFLASIFTVLFALWAICTFSLQKLYIFEVLLCQEKFRHRKHLKASFGARWDSIFSWETMVHQAY